MSKKKSEKAIKEKVVQKQMYIINPFKHTINIKVQKDTIMLLPSSSLKHEVTSKADVDLIKKQGLQILLK